MDPLGSIKEVFIVIVLILMNGLLAMLEMALVSARKSRLEQLADEGSSKAAYILKLAQEPTEFLSTVQIGITLVGIGTGVYSGAMLAAPLEGLLREISVLRPYAGVVSYTFVVALVTYLSLILGELIPKKMALNNPEKVAMSFAGFIKVIITAFKPLTVPAWDHQHAWHLFIIRVDEAACGISRDALMEKLKAMGIGTGLHFRAAHTQKYYRERFPEVSLPNTEWNSARICSLPLFPDMTDDDVTRVISALRQLSGR